MSPQSRAEHDYFSQGSHSKALVFAGQVGFDATSQPYEYNIKIASGTQYINELQCSSKFCLLKQNCSRLGMQIQVCLP